MAKESTKGIINIEISPFCESRDTDANWARAKDRGETNLTRTQSHFCSMTLRDIPCD